MRLSVPVTAFVLSIAAARAQAPAAASAFGGPTSITAPQIEGFSAPGITRLNHRQALQRYRQLRQTQTARFTTACYPKEAPVNKVALVLQKLTQGTEAAETWLLSFPENIRKIEVPMPCPFEQQ